ncbi:hypothetical protein HMPREF1869_00570 [Bacteroidales bacterium KA00251]|nr:hypothetical protein HMPREF1869_00570 [Bacteroidales bacterium KA00251]
MFLTFRFFFFITDNIFLFLIAVVKSTGLYGSAHCAYTSAQTWYKYKKISGMSNSIAR